tara:strand:+ start:3114 stop:3893 length:780 start_codon:yes stop_codon:yes gene_type:complete
MLFTDQKCVSCLSVSKHIGQYYDEYIDSDINHNLFKCNNCGLYFFDRTNITENIYKKNKLSTNTKKPRHDMLKNIINKEISNGKILDIGAGEAYIVNSLNPNNYEFTIIDYHKPKNLPKGAEFIKSGIDEIDVNFFNENKFDCIILDNVLEHIMEPNDSIEKVVNWLSNEGFLIIAVPNRWNLKHILKLQFNKEFYHPFEHVNIFTSKSLNFMMNDKKLYVKKVFCKPNSFFSTVNFPSLLGFPIFGIYFIYKKSLNKI